MKLLNIFIALMFSFNSLVWAIDQEPHDHIADQIIVGLQSLSATPSGLAISHYNHPAYNELSFLYDNVVVAMAFYYAGKKQKAAQVMDFYHNIIQDAKENIAEMKDYTGIYGAAKLLQFGDKQHIGLVNSLNVNVKDSPGSGRLEFNVTPGPSSFLIFAFLHINKEKYRESALMIGELILAMQNDAGGVLDGDRSRTRIHTEPHADAYAAFIMLYDLTADDKWHRAASKAQNWFLNTVYDSEENIIWQGFWDGELNKVLAEDAFSWAILSGITDTLSDEKLYALNMKLLELFLVQIELELPGQEKKKLFLVDFTDPTVKEAMEVRQGLHPMGSVEWSAGAILALQKSASRLHMRGKFKEAKQLKAIAELMLKDGMGSFYKLPTKAGLFTFYATGQGVEVGPFGAIKESLKEGWLTPFYNVQGQDYVRGACSIGSWMLFPYWGINPFKLVDIHRMSYDKIELSGLDLVEAKHRMLELTEKKSYVETVPREIKGGHTIIVEPRDYNKRMWDAFNKAERINDKEESTVYYKTMQEWANKVLADDDWLELSKEQSIAKMDKHGGLLEYSWGKVVENNDDSIHHQVFAYPILNEIGAAYWGLIVSSYELGQKENIDIYFKDMVEHALLHQIPQVRNGISGEALIEGYWSAIAQFTRPIYPTQRDKAIYDYLKDKLGTKYLDEVYQQL